MARKLYRVVDSDGQDWFLAAEGFGAAVARMKTFEGEQADVFDEAVVESVILAGVLIEDGDTRDGIFREPRIVSAL